MLCQANIGTSSISCWHDCHGWLFLPVVLFFVRSLLSWMLLIRWMIDGTAECVAFLPACLAQIALPGPLVEQSKTLSAQLQVFLLRNQAATLAVMV